MATRTSPRDKVRTALTAESSPARQNLVGLFVDQLLDLRVSEVVDPEELTDLLLLAITAENTRRWVDDHARPGFRRHLSRFEGTRHTFAEGLEPATRRKLEKLVAEAKLPNAKWARDAIDPKLAKNLVAPIIQDLVTGFSRKLPMLNAGVAEDARQALAGGLGGRLFAKVEQRAGKFVEAGKAVLGGVSAEMEAKVQSVARDFSQNATNEVKNALLARVASAEGKDLVSRMRTQLLARYLETPIEQLNLDLREMPIDQYLDLLPELLEFNRKRPEIRIWVREEVYAAMDKVGESTLRALLLDAGLLDNVRASLARSGDTLARRVFESAAFGEWLDEVL